MYGVCGHLSFSFNAFPQCHNPRTCSSCVAYLPYDDGCMHFDVFWGFATLIVGLHNPQLSAKLLMRRKKIEEDEKKVCGCYRFRFVVYMENPIDCPHPTTSP